MYYSYIHKMQNIQLSPRLIYRLITDRSIKKCQPLPSSREMNNEKPQQESDAEKSQIL